MSDKPIIDQYADPLTSEQTKAAVESLVNRYPRVIRQNIDPPVPNQTHSLVSIDLFKEPKKDRDGKPVYGFVKVRGSYSNQTSAETEAGKLIKNVDSNTRILIIPTGHWYPISPNERYISDKLDVRMNEEEVQLRDQAVKEKNEERKRIMRELKEREDELKNDGDVYDHPESLDKYTMKRNTEMNLTNEIRRARAALEKLELRRKQIWKELKRLDEAFPTHTDEWLEQHNKAFTAVGLPAFIPRADQFSEYESISLDDLKDVPDLRPDEQFVMPDPIKKVAE